MDEQMQISTESKPTKKSTKASAEKKNKPGRKPNPNKASAAKQQANIFSTVRAEEKPGPFSVFTVQKQAPVSSARKSETQEVEEDDIQEQEVEKLLDILAGNDDDDDEEEAFEYIDDEGNKLEEGSVKPGESKEKMEDEDEDMNEDEY
mmetsp:Transcript_917/g.562  ORF Transcript_917/g.562 Transcript_917/m.562 type:complete len:148 (+) Transcript_917:2186-2629(+)|eukprot:CAMPEP_0202959364 /NCGR_PEP_ID=MMETSP1396-20130829/3563_1 /ASSEMBLY_ACC=CAM_ASM_000872 /TAXON_ID= /ORGANISM="Pseudokeronopsis sp., Strain Brazil" /LENGTH=147 /DNA_ID=CAMNT_0049677883 /DNA_START=2671 /DNA_END=3114 /DNA_ORIENTATION=-